MLVLVPALVVYPGHGPSFRVFAWGGAGGLAGSFGLLLLYTALSSGNMSVVSPVSGVTAAVIPVVVGTVLLGERPDVLAMIGIACALAAIVLVTLHPGGAGGTGYARSVLTAVGAGSGFGLFFVCLQRAGSPREVGLWAALAARPVSIAVAVAIARLRHAPLVPQRPERRLIALGGVLDQGANVLYILSIGRGLLAVLAVLASLYPVSTIVLARVIDHETLAAHQLTGLGLAFAALVLIAV